MAVFHRVKKVTDPLDDKAKARLRGHDDVHHRVTGYASSGSGHDSASPCLSGLVHAFLENLDSDSPGGAAQPHGGSDDDGEDRDSAATAILRELMDPAAEPKNWFRLRLAADVFAAVEGLTGLRASCGAAALRQAVMARLRASQYNAGICKVRWESSAELNAGSYEYIDVVAGGAAAAGEFGRRYIVDLEFAGEFEVARATEEYKRVVAALPRVAVAGEEAVRQVVRVVADAAQRSLRARDLHVPPWRTSPYMTAKWLGPYRRTTNAVSSGTGGAEVNCRFLGFTAAAGGLVVAPATRTR